MLVISLNCATEPTDLISDATTAYEAWTLLKNQYQGAGHNLKQTYITELYNIDYKQFNSITSFIVRFKKLVSSLAQVNMKLPDDFYIITFINALQSVFPVWAERQWLNARSTTSQVTLESLYTDITDKARQSGTVKSNLVALYSNNPQKNRMDCKSNRNSKPKVCGHCSKPGHTEDKC
jgi:hypothetical protein